MDINFDGVVSLSDLQSFLQKTFNVDVNRYRLKIERVFKILDHSKTGSIFLVDFENTFFSRFLDRSITLLVLSELKVLFKSSLKPMQAS
jgi:hypothetical protein